MAEAAQAEQSESMEEILQSIKRIIEDDTVEPATTPAADVFELTNVVAEEDSAAKIDAAVQELATIEEPSAPVQAAIDAAFEEKKPAASKKPSADKLQGLMSDQAAQAAAIAFKPIVESTMKDYSIPHIPSPEFRNGKTVEDLVLESLKPMIKDWLDENLPVIVQKIVEKEVKRIVTLHND